MVKTKKYTAYEEVQKARDKERPGITDYIDALFEDFIEMHGDRLHRDDPAIVAGIATFKGIPVTVIGHRKGRETQEQIEYNFGMASPEGYRKAKRLMEQAERFHRPVITFIDTPGAYPGIEAENNGQSNAIASSIAYMSMMKTPSIAVVTGEGSSGGALAIAAADKVLMLEHAVYSILSPEGFASILWKDPKMADKASEVMRLTSYDLLEDGFIDGIVREDDKLIKNLEVILERELGQLLKVDIDTLLKKRYLKYRRTTVRKSK